MNELTCLLLISAVVFLGGLNLNFIIKTLIRNKHRESLKEQFDKTNLLILPLYQKDGKYNFVVDTGSTCNLIKPKLLRKLVHTKYKCDTETVIASGESISGGEVANIMFASPSGEVFVEDFIILDGLDAALKSTEKELGEKVAGILGTDFLRHYSKILDFNNCTIE